MKFIFIVLILFSSHFVYAEYGINFGFNNPSYTDNGINFMYSESKWAIEVGIGRANLDAVDDEAYGNAIGDVDVKYYFSQPLGIYVETGLMTNYSFHGGADPSLSFNARSPFFGFGIAYINKVIFYGSLSYNLVFGDLYTAWGFGIFL